MSAKKLIPNNGCSLQDTRIWRLINKHWFLLKTPFSSIFRLKSAFFDYFFKTSEHLASASLLARLIRRMSPSQARIRQIRSMLMSFHVQPVRRSTPPFYTRRLVRLIYSSPPQYDEQQVITNRTTAAIRFSRTTNAFSLNIFQFLINKKSLYTL